LCSSFLSPASAQAKADLERKDVLSWLMRIHEAASHRNFQGTFIVSAGGAVSSAHIAHYCQGSNQYEHIESLDGETRHVLRHNDLVHTLWPHEHVAVVEQRNKLSSFPAILQGGEGHIADFYEVRSQGLERVAGHEANVLLLRPRDAYRFGYRLWSESASGLLLRADVLGDQGEILESSAFSDVSINVKPQPDAVMQPMKRLDGYRVVKAVFTPTSLDAEGWSLHPGVPGFRQVSCIRRPLDGPQRIEQGGPGSEALQTTFSDGLTHVSVFIEPFNPERNTKSMLTTIGATKTMMRRQGDWWVTVVGDVPATTLKAFAFGLSHKAEHKK